MVQATTLTGKGYEGCTSVRRGVTEQVFRTGMVECDRPAMMLGGKSHFRM